MLRVLGLVLTLGLFLCISSCTSPGPNTNAPVTPGISPSPGVTATATPTASPTAPSPTAPTTASVKGSNFKWVDDASGTNVTTIKVGGTVTWTATGNHELERVPAANGCSELEASFNSDRITQPVSRTFNTVGTFGYHCGVHGGTPNCTNPTASEGMAGIIKVVP